MQPDLILGDDKLEAEGALDVHGNLAVDGNVSLRSTLRVEGDVRINGRIRKPLTFLRGLTPMLYVADEDVDLLRPVIAHSPDRTRWGLLYSGIDGDKMIFQGDGRPGLTVELTQQQVGINTDNPRHNLHVNGSAAGTQGFQTLSDARCKTDISRVDDALEIVQALRGVRFAWDRERCDGLDVAEGRQVGFLAQEVERVLPEVVRADADGTRSVDYGAVVPVLTEAVKDQQDQIHAQAKCLGALETENATLRAALARMEERLARIEASSPAPDAAAALRLR